MDELGIKTVINLGDTFDRRKYSNHVTLYRAKEMFFQPLKERDIWCPTIIGNHDSFHKNTNKVNSMELVCNENHYPNLQIINDPRVLDIHGYNVLMVPWICMDNESDCFRMLASAPTDLCMGHFGINGFLMQVGMVAETGLNRNVFDRFDMVLSGHFHHRSSDGRIYYLGNPTEMTWHDYGDQKGFHILDLETRYLTYIENPFHMFHRIIYNDELNLDNTYLNLDNNLYKNTYVKVVVEKKTQPEFYDKFMEGLYNVNPFSVSVVQNYSDILEIAEEFVPDQAHGTLQMLHTYLDSAKVQAGIDVPTLKNIFTDIYNESVNVEN